MDHLKVGFPGEMSSIKLMAIEDAKKMQASVIESSRRAGRDPPGYHLVELIGKGSYGRVYKGKDLVSAAFVAVKIIDLDTSDLMGNGDAYSEFLKEMKALKTLSEVRARNINHVIDAFPVDQSMWMVTEYCGGGSVATLMRPSAPGGLKEQWIIPILREVAEAVKWVHQSGLIHRDIKCANVLITEEGQVQLCDFGIAAPIETKVDKRTTFIGTPHWMAPELFDSNPSYGKEVDIWAFGAMAYEIATGLPPNALSGIPYDRLGQHTRQRVPRLEGDEYSEGLKDIVAFCLQRKIDRPPIEQVQRHPYILDTSAKYPTSSLKDLVLAFKLFEERGGARKSLFNPGGAQARPELSSTAQSDDNWNFSTTDAFDETLKDAKPQAIVDAYGERANDQASRPRPGGRRRPPPEALAPLRGPLEKIFDPNTLTSYNENSRVHYGRMPIPPASSDLPLRDDTAQTSIRDTMIDLDGPDLTMGDYSDPDGFGFNETLKAGPRIVRDDYDDQDFSRPAISDPADNLNANRRTQDWKFPTMMPPASAEPETTSFGFNDSPDPYETSSNVRPPLIHHPTEPIGMPSAFTSGNSSAEERFSLIDLDLSLPVPLPRPSTANSDAPGNPFELERHASLYYDGPNQFGNPFNGSDGFNPTPRQESPPGAPGSVPYAVPSFTKESSPDSIGLDRDYTTSSYEQRYNLPTSFPYDKGVVQNSIEDVKMSDSGYHQRDGQWYPHYRHEIPESSSIDSAHTDADGRIWVKYELYNGFVVPPWVKEQERRLDIEYPNRIREYPENAWANYPDVVSEGMDSRFRDEFSPSSVQLANPQDPRRFTIEPWSKELEQYIRARDNASPNSGFVRDPEKDEAYAAIKAFNSHKPQNVSAVESVSSQRHYNNVTKVRSKESLPRSHREFYDIPVPPSMEAMMGLASDGELRLELDRLVGGLLTHLDAFKQSYENIARRSRV